MKKRLIILSSIGVIVILLVSIVLTSIVSLSINTKENTFRELNILLDNTDIRVGNTINFTIENLPNNSNITWNLGDGNYSSNEITSHIYSKPGYYLIQVDAFWKNGKGNGSIEIGVKNVDYYNHGSGDVVRDLRIGSGTGRSMGHSFVPGISEPYYKLDIVLFNVIGIIEYYIYVDYEYDYGWEWNTMFSERTTASYETLSIQKEIPRIPVDCDALLVHIYGGFIIWEGRVESSEIEINVIF